MGPPPLSLFSQLGQQAFCVAVPLPHQYEELLLVQHKGNDLSKLLFAFGIRQVGQKAGKILAARFGSLDALAQAPEEDG